MLTKKPGLSRDRCFSPEPVQRRLAHQFFDSISALPLVCPHGRVDPGILLVPKAGEILYRLSDSNFQVTKS